MRYVEGLDVKKLREDPTILTEKHLDLRGSVTIAALKKLIANGNTATLHIYCAELGAAEKYSKASVRDWSGAKALEEGVFGWLKCSPAALATLRCLPNLRVLSWQDGKFERAHIRALAHCKRLESLDLESSRIGDSSARILAHMHALKSLDIGSTNVTDAGLLALLQLPQLERLDMWNTCVTDSGLHAISNAKKLKYLSFGRTYFNANGSHPYASSETVDALLRHPSLERVWLHGVVVSSEQAAALMAKMPMSKIEAPERDW